MDLADAIKANTGRITALRCLLELRRKHMATPKLRGVAERLKMLHHNLDADADKLNTAIDAVEVKREHVFDKSHKTVAGAHEVLKGVNDYLDDLERSNSPPRSTDVATREDR